MTRKCVLFGYCTILGLVVSKSSADQTPVTFTFKEFQYKDSPKNEMTFREFETACEQSSACNHMSGLSKTRCVRECVSPSCYRELYQVDPLEDGEIDVRLNSFKGCFIQRISYCHCDRESQHHHFYTEEVKEPLLRYDSIDKYDVVTYS